MPLTGYNQSFIFILQCVLVATVYLSLFRLRKFFGLTLLAIALGITQFLQVFLAGSLNYELFSFITISSGSTVLFSASIFVILLIYIKENAEEARKIIYALVVANFLLVLLLYIFSNAYEGNGFESIYNLPKGFFIENARVLFFGTILLFVDSLMLILLFKYISKYIHSLFFSMFFVVTLVLLVDSFIFSAILFYNESTYKNILISNLISKPVVSFIYSSLFTIYIVFIDKSSSKNKLKSSNTYADILNLLTFRKKYKQLIKDKIKIKRDLIYTKEYLQTIFDATSDAIFIHDAKNGKILDVNKQMCSMFGYSRQEVILNNVQPFSFGKYPYSKVEADQWNKAIKDGEQTFEWQSKHKNGMCFGQRLASS